MTETHGSVTAVRRWIAAMFVLWLALPVLGQDPGDPALDDRAVMGPPRKLADSLAAAETELAQQNYPAAVRRLQGLLDHSEDFFLDEGKSLKQTAARLLANLSEAGREAYELEYGPKARVLWDQVRATGDETLLADLLRHYWLTKAGQTATRFAARRALDRGQTLRAALHGADLQVRSEPLDAVPEATAWWQSGHPQRAVSALRALPTNTPRQAWPRDVPPRPEAWDEMATRSWLSRWLPEPLQHQPLITDWRQSRGNSARNAAVAAPAIISSVLWRHSTLDGLIGKDGHNPQINAARLDWFTRQLRELTAQGVRNDQILLPACEPLIVGQTAVVRGWSGIEARRLADGELLWRSSLRDSGLRQRESFWPLTDEPTPQRDDFQRWLKSRGFRDATTGTLSSNGELIFSVEAATDEGLLQPTRMVALIAERVAPPNNKLCAWNLRTGRLEWELGGDRREGSLLLAGTSFLGTPLVREDRLCALIETAGEIRLLELALGEAGPVPVWSQTVAVAQDVADPASTRRVSGLAPTGLDNWLICPTGAGLIVAVDTLRQQLVWSFRYPPLLSRFGAGQGAFGQTRAFAQNMSADDDETRPLDEVCTIAEGRVILGPRDAREWFCVDLIDGRLLWKRPRRTGQFLGTVDDGRVIVVGKTLVEAWHLESGQPAWSAAIPIALPAGRGVLAGQQFTLPLVTGELVTIDLDHGQVVARSTILPEVPLGHLVAANGQLLTQNAESILALPSQSLLAETVAVRLKQDAEEPQALAWRGESRLHRGELTSGLEDLRTALRRQPDLRQRSVLTAALLDQIRRDPLSDMTLLDEARRWAVEPAQRSEVLRLVARRQADTGDRVAAWRTWLELAQALGSSTKLMQLDADRMIAPQRLLHAELRALYVASSPRQRRDLETLLAEHIRRYPKDAEEVIACLNLKIPGLELEAERRVWLKDRAATDSARLRQLDRLSASPTLEQAGFATAELARTALNRTDFAEAAWQLERLEREFAEIVVREDATGHEVAAVWRSELPPSQPRGWPEADIEVRRRPFVGGAVRSLPVDVIGEPQPWQADWSWETIGQSALVARDAAGRQRYAVTLPETLGRQTFGMSNSSFGQLFLSERWLALTFGGQVLLLDAATPDGVPRVHWQRSLTQSGTQDPYATGGNALRMEWLASGRRRVRNRESLFRSNTGRLLGLTADTVFIRQGERIVATDASTGQVVWNRVLSTETEVEAIVEGDHLALYGEKGDVLVLATLDGAEIARRKLGEPHEWVWLGGRQQGALQWLDDGVVYAHVDLLRGESVWSQRFPRSSRVTVVNSRELIAVTPAGAVVAFRLSDGQKLWETKLPDAIQPSFVFCQRRDRRYWIFAGNSSPISAQQSISPIDAQQTPFTGVIAAIDVTDGAASVAWVTPLGPTALDILQPVSSPVILATGRLQSAARQGNQVFGLSPDWKLTATFVDRRTGDVLYSTTEGSPRGGYAWTLDGERQTLTATFETWQLEFQVGKPPEAPRKPE